MPCTGMSLIRSDYSCSLMMVLARSQGPKHRPLAATSRWLAAPRNPSHQTHMACHTDLVLLECLPWVCPTGRQLNRGQECGCPDVGSTLGAAGPAAQPTATDEEGLVPCMTLVAACTVDMHLSCGATLSLSLSQCHTCGKYVGICMPCKPRTVVPPPSTGQCS